MHDTALPWLGTDTSIKIGYAVKYFLIETTILYQKLMIALMRCAARHRFSVDPKQ
jgi:hypothetical protein